MAKPFVKWAGGKRSQALAIVARFPERFRRYFEPFVGGGAVFLALRAAGYVGRASLIDINPDLIAAWRAVRDNPDRLIRRLRDHARAHGPDHFMRVRTQPTEGLSDVVRGARAIYLNKTCFNGLWRVNKRGLFNVPMGRFVGAPKICDESGILDASITLKHAAITCADFGRVWRRAQPGDVVYFDPPYLPEADLPSFTSYARDGFTMSDQERLADLCLCLAQTGVHVFASGADTKETRALYEARGAIVERTEAARAINSDATKRGLVGELFIRWEVES